MDDRHQIVPLKESDVEEYLSYKRKEVNRQSIKHVYTGEAVIDSEELNQIQYRDIRGNYITTECSLLEDIDQEISDIVCITLEDERIVKVKPRNISDSSITN